MRADLSRVPFTGEPGRLALVEADGDTAGRCLTLYELDRLVDRFAAETVRRLPDGGRVAIAAENGVFSVAATLGVMRGGATAVPLNLRLPDAALADTLADCGAAFAFATEDVANRMPIPSLSEPSEGQGGSQPRDPALIMYTSGSTGRPKGVPIRHRGYCWALNSFAGLADRVAGRRGLVAAPLFHMNGQFHLWNMLSCGATVVLMRRFDARHMLSLVDREDVSRITGVPTMMALAVQALEQGHPADMRRVTSIAMGSAPFAPELMADIRRWFPNAEVTNGFGTTETGPVSFGASPEGLPTPPGALGVPMPGVEWRLVDGPSPNEGMLELRNPMTLEAYWNRPEETARKLVDGWYRTGDRMRRDDRGFFWFAGRSDDMIVTGGENVHPEEVEQALAGHPSVLQAAVVAVPHRTKHRVPVAFVVPRPHASIDEEVLKAFALEHLPPYAHPRRVIAIPSMPLMAQNKIDRSRLTALAAERIGVLG
jgi:acyl-CoA synthetase (AMP-forming)/AMP-acid ligase II